MFYNAQVLGCATAWVLASGLTSTSFAQADPPTHETRMQSNLELVEEWVRCNPRSRLTAQEHPVVQQNREHGLKSEEREALGLPAPTWVTAHGKVQPAVRAALEDQQRRIAAKEPMIQFQGDRPAGFHGTAYVDVYLRHQLRGEHASKENQAAIKEIQTRVLGKLTAAEFSLIFAFQNTAGMTGYISESALTKLTSDPDVVAVGLDDQVRPVDRLRARGDDYDTGSPDWRGTIEASVYRALAESPTGYVFVVMNLRVPPPDGSATDTSVDAVQSAHRRVFSRLTAEEFLSRAWTETLTSGYVNAPGLAKLAQCPAVVRVGLDRRAVLSGNVRKEKD